MGLKEAIRKKLYGYRASSESYIEYLRSMGADIGENVTNIAQRKRLLRASLLLC